MNVDAELENWRHEWQQADTVPFDLRASVARQTRAMRLWLAADILVTVAMGGWTTAWAVLSRQAEVVLLAAATWLFIGMAWVFTLTVNAGKWTPAALDTGSFLDLSVRRCRARLSSIAFGAGLAVCEIVFCLAWVYRYSVRGTPVLAWLLFSSVPIDIVWLFAALVFGLLFWYRRKKRAELAYLLQLQRQCANGADAVPLQ